MIPALMRKAWVWNATLAVAAVGAAAGVFFLDRRSARSTQVAPVSAQEYDSVIANGRPTLIDFYADWCVGCQMNAPVLEELEHRQARRVNFLRVDVDKPENASFSRRFHVDSIPRYVFLAVGGSEVGVKVGWQTDAELRAAVNTLTGNPPQSRPRDASGGLYGYVDRSGRMVIPPRFTLASEFFSGEAYVQVGGREALIDHEGRLKRYLTPKETELTSAENRLPFEVNGKWGFLGQDSKPTIPARYDEVTDFADNRAGVRIGKRWGFIDRSGTPAIPVQFDEVQRFWAGRAAVRIGECWGLINTQGKIIIPVQFEQVGRFRKSEALVPVRKRGLWGFLDAKGRWVVEPRFEGVETTRQGMSPVRQGGLWGFIDNSGRLVVQPRYEKVGAFSEGLAWVYASGKYTFIDRTGKQLTGFLFDRVRSFSSDGLAAVEVGGRWGYIDRSGRFVLTPRFADASLFSQGLAAVKPAVDASQQR